MITVRLPNGEDISVNTDDPQAAAQAGQRYWASQGNAVPAPAPATGPVDTPLEAAPRSAKDVLTGAVTNLPGSVVKNVVDTAKSLVDPETYKFLGKAYVGGLQRSFPNMSTEGDLDKRQYAQALNDALYARYGTGNNIARTVQNDPGGILMDLSALATGGGAALKGAGTLGRMGAEAGSLASRAAGGLVRAGGGLMSAGAAIDPLRAIYGLSGKVGGVVGGGMDLLTGGAGLPERVAYSAIKPSFNGTPAERALAVKSALENKLVPNASSPEKLNRLIQEQADNAAYLATMYDKSGPGATVPRSDLVQGADKYTFGQYKDLVNPEKPLADAQEVYRQFLAAGDPNMTARQLLDTKVATGQRLPYGADVNPATITANKAVVHEINKALGDLVPDIKPVNEKLSGLLELKPELARAFARQESINPINLPGVVFSPSNLMRVAILADTIKRPLANAGEAIGQAMTRSNRATALPYGLRYFGEQQQ